MAAPTSPIQIRPYEAADWPAVWALLEPVFRAGETFPHDPAITDAEAKVAWVGTYYLRPNSLALGAHVANAGYVVAETCRQQALPALPAGRATAFRWSAPCRGRSATSGWATWMPR